MLKVQQQALEVNSLELSENVQDLEISHLKKKLQVRDQQQSDLQAKWNFHSFKYQLLIDMASPLCVTSTSLGVTWYCLNAQHCEAHHLTL